MCRCVRLFCSAEWPAEHTQTQAARRSCNPTASKRLAPKMQGRCAARWSTTNPWLARNLRLDVDESRLHERDRRLRNPLAVLQGHTGSRVLLLQGT
eukprot:1820143-Pleurochrysis_carterae.AAC.1